MDADEQTRSGFAAIRDRLDEIAAQVRSDDMPLDAALDLYDEAVKLGMKATELLETIEEGDHAESGEEAR
ncbi:exodeoxyribonuclease VII small subunit [uncultured Slackia sp.]|uniref:exodeoxyribonuclease VII small subunit n=1 Tax=uncultured Slackia sp. TaxID=665903 RepID=UPI0026DEB13B|nr:exodeoxyribonuclease VII small subunit [uncultured Slackia sp.]